MTRQIETLHLDQVVKAHTQDMTNKVAAITGTTSGTVYVCARELAVSGNFYGPKDWTGFPDLLPPEDLLLDPENIKINRDGCEAAVGAFVF